jgi:hypothetical protein
VAHWWCKGQRKFLVRYKGFGLSFDEWKREEDVSEQLRLLRPPRNQIPADTFRRKGETETSGRRDAEGDGHAHLGGVLVEISLGICVSDYRYPGSIDGRRMT